MAVISENEVLLYGTRFPIIGTVTSTLLDSFPPRIVEGDPGRTDEITSSSWEMSDLSGGVGVMHATQGSEHRYWFGTLDTRFPHQIALAPLVTKRAANTDITGFIDYQGDLYAFAGTQVYKWDEAGQTFGASIKTFTGNVTAAAFNWGPVVGGDPYGEFRLYLAFDNTVNLQYFNGATWTTVTGPTFGTSPGTPYAGGFLSLATHRAQTYALQPDGHYALMEDHSNESGMYGRLDGVGTSGAKQLVVLFNSAGSPFLGVITNKGLTLFQTPFSVTQTASANVSETPWVFPPHPNIGVADSWQGALYLPIGGGIYRITTQEMSAVGPDLDEGLPSDMRGPIVLVAAAHAGYFALIDGSEAGTYASLLFTPGAGWGVAWKDDTPGRTAQAAYVSSANNTYRLWWATTGGVYTMDLPTTLLNPLQNPTTDFQASGELITSWFTADWPVLTKLALRAEAITHQCSATETVTLAIQYDDDADWTPLGTITTDGITTFEIGANTGGKPFRSVRFKVDMARGADTTKTPILESISLTYVKRPKPVWGRQFTIDLSKSYKGKTVGQLRKALEDIFTSDTAGILSYRPEGANETTDMLVLPARSVGTDLTGLKLEGRFQMSVVQLKTST